MRKELNKYIDSLKNNYSRISRMGLMNNWVVIQEASEEKERVYIIKN